MAILHGKTLSIKCWEMSPEEHPLWGVCSFLGGSLSEVPLYSPVAFQNFLCHVLEFRYVPEDLSSSGLTSHQYQCGRLKRTRVSGMAAVAASSAMKQAKKIKKAPHGDLRERVCGDLVV